MIENKNEMWKLLSPISMFIKLSHCARAPLLHKMYSEHTHWIMSICLFAQLYSMHTSTQTTYVMSSL